MIPSPIHRVLSVTTTHGVASLLMGGQACILYGAAEFSRDVDLAIVADSENLSRLSNALEELEAAVTAVPPFEARYLERGHAVHFRCGRDDVRGLRIDVMARMRGVDAFPALWARRTTLSLPAEADQPLQVDLLALPTDAGARRVLVARAADSRAARGVCGGVPRRGTRRRGTAPRRRVGGPGRSGPGRTGTPRRAAAGARRGPGVLGARSP